MFYKNILIKSLVGVSACAGGASICHRESTRSSVGEGLLLDVDVLNLISQRSDSKTKNKKYTKHSFRFCPQYEKDFRDLNFLLKETDSFRKDWISGFLISLLAPTVLKAITDVEWSPEMSTNSIVATTWETALKTLATSPHSAAHIFSKSLSEMTYLEEMAMKRTTSSKTFAEGLCSRIKEHIAYWNEVITEQYSDLEQKEYYEKIKKEFAGKIHNKKR